LIGYVDAGAGINYSPNSGYGLGPAYYADSKLSVVSEFSLAMPSEMLAIGEARYLGRGMNDYPGGADMLLCGWRNWPDIRNARRITAYTELRHGKNYNQLFCDGHVGALNPSFLFNPTNSAAMWNNDHQPHRELWYP